jgi:fucose 4-O-acetylase-like acetyltransferase
MDSDTFLFFTRLLIGIGWSVALVVWLGYTLVAPWHKYSAGRYIWGLLGGIVAVLSASMLRFLIPGIPFRMEIIIFTLALFDAALIGMGWGIYKAQILRYHKAKILQKHRENHK